MADALGQLAVACFGGAFGQSRGQQRAHHLRVAAQAGQANSGRELARRQVHDEQAARGGRLDGADPVLCMSRRTARGSKMMSGKVARLDEARADGGQDCRWETRLPGRCPRP